MSPDVDRRARVVFLHGGIVAFGAAGTRTVADLAHDCEAVCAVLPASSADSQLVLVCEDRYLFAVGLLAAWQAGYSVALPPNTRSGSVIAIAERAGATTILHDTDEAVGLDLRKAIATRASTRRASTPSPDATRVWPPMLEPDRVIATLYTSGTTREFRSVSKTASQLYREVAALQATFALQPMQPVVGTVPSHHLYGLLFTVLWPLSVGAPFSRDVPLHVEAVVDRLRMGAQHSNMAAPMLVTVPAHLAGFRRLPPRELEGLRVFSSTAPLAFETARDLVDTQGVELFEIFGSTETGGIGWRRSSQESGWRPLPGVAVSVDGGAHLCLASEFLASRELFRTDDRVELLADGTFVHVGRADDIVKVGGRRISLSHLEAGLRRVPGVVDAAVVATLDPGPRGTRIVAVLVAPGLSAALIREAMGDSFDAATLPRRYVFCDAIPREPNGKTRRERLLEVIASDHREPSSTEPSQSVTRWSADPAASRELQVSYLGAVPGKPGTTTEVHLFEVSVRDDAWHFDGHFPGFPILPGISLLHSVVMPAVSLIHPGEVMLREVTRLKFRRPVRPGDRLILQLSTPSIASPFSNDAQYEFVATREDEVVSSGRLRLGVT